MSAAGRGRSGRALTSTRDGRAGRRDKATASAVVALTVLLVAAVPVAPTSVAPVEPAAHLSAAAASADVIRGRQWWLSALHITGAWKWSKGRGVTVAVLDTGVDGRHPDLTGQVVNGEDYTGRVRSPGNKYWGRHGSAMASIIAGHGHGSGLSAGVMGIAPQAKILSIRVTWENDDPLRARGAEADSNRDAVATGIRYAVDHGADIINMSLGGGKVFYNGNPTEEDAIRYALSKGAVLIASSGNDGAGANRKNFPAAYPGVIAVGAVDRNLRPWADSNRHSYVKVAAPGVDIVSADAGGGYVLGTGTSPSAAVVAGIAALIRSRYPKLTSVQVAQAMEKGVARNASGRSSAVGAGVTDAVRALSAANTINKTAYAGESVRAPLPDPQTVPVANEGGPNRLIIGVIAGIGGFLLICLVRALRRRRRPDQEYEAYDEDEYEPERWFGEGEPRRLDAAGLNGSPQAGDIAPVNVPPWQSMEALAPAPPPMKSTERQVWPPPQETQADPASGVGSGIDGSGGLDRPEPVTFHPFDVPAAPHRPSGNRAKGRVNEFRLDFGAESLEAPGPPDEQLTDGYRMVSPDDRRTNAFRVVPPAPDEQVTDGYRMVSPDDQRTAAFRVVPPVPDGRPATGPHGAPPPVPGEQRAAGSRAVPPVSGAGTHDAPPVPDGRPAAGNERTPPAQDERRTVAFRATPPATHERPAAGDEGTPRVQDERRTAAFRAAPPAPAERPAAGNHDVPPLDERQSAALRAALAGRYRRGEITRNEFYAGLAELREGRRRP